MAESGNAESPDRAVVRLQRQLDDLTAVVQEHQRHFEQLWDEGFLGDLDGPTCAQSLRVPHEHVGDGAE